MTIDEAIAHAREVADEQKRRNGICVQNDSECDKFSSCIKCAEEHEQIAEWLEELKELREYFNSTEIGKYRFQKGYNKAIDDFVNVCKENIMYKTFGLRESDIEGIAEQLKAGGENKC